MRYSLVALITLLLISGCAPKKKHAKLPLNQNTNIEFKGIRNGQCKVADVLINAKGGYVVVCQ